MNVRPAAVAGLFYPEAPVELARTVDACLDAAPASGSGLDTEGVIAPHAGYRFSGAVAGSAFRSLSTALGALQHVIVIGPSHHLAFEGIATSPADRFRTPLGEIDVDREGASTLERLPGVAARPEAHAREHSIEVELPFLQRLVGAFDLLPLVVGGATAERVGHVLAAALDRRPGALIVSSDLSHFLTSADARRADERTAQRIEGRATDLEPEAACGAVAINGLCVLARERGWAIQRLDLRNSGDATGDETRVVGYGAFAFGMHSGEARREVPA